MPHVLAGVGITTSNAGRVTSAVVMQGKVDGVTSDRCLADGGLRVNNAGQ